jgi:CheY-like chemotaxis protein
MPEGGTLTLKTTWVDPMEHPENEPSKEDAFVILSVTDTGCGMDEETRKHLFEPFFSTKGEEGTGLGLATVYGIVRQHGGSVRVETAPGEGAAFHIFLPVNETRPEPNPIVQPAAANLEGVETILLVEDNDRVRNSTRHMLQRHGYIVIAAESGKHALRILDESEKPIQMLLTDVIMPEMNGISLYGEVTSRYPTIKVLFMSGYAEDILFRRFHANPSVHFIQKPFQLHDLLVKVREVLAL